MTEPEPNANLLTEAEFNAISSASTAEEWNEQVRLAKKAHGGWYPHDWYTRIVASGVQAKAFARLGGERKGWRSVGSVLLTTQSKLDAVLQALDEAKRMPPSWTPLTIATIRDAVANLAFVVKEQEGRLAAAEQSASAPGWLR